MFEAKAWRNATGAKRNLVIDICGLSIGGIVERDLLGLGAAYDGLVEAIVVSELADVAIADRHIVGGFTDIEDLASSAPKVGRARVLEKIGIVLSASQRA